MGVGGGHTLATITSNHAVTPGMTFGRYVIQSLIARGGMGEVWLATARGPGDFRKRVVIKTVLPHLVAKPGYVEMLVKEASLAARLDHPNIVNVFDLGCVGSHYYIAMEYLSGRTLGQMVHRAHQVDGTVPVPILFTMIAACCDGLHYAHDYSDDDGKPLGVLHRDISPSNIMLTFAGRVALLDFGVATACGRFQTRSGAIKGKFNFLAPERVRGEAHDRRSDVYALGVVLYQCLSRRLPFHADNDYDLLRSIARGKARPLRHYVPTIAEPVERLVMRAMAHDAAARPADAAQLAAELRGYLRSTGQVVEPRRLAEYLAGLFDDVPEAAAVRDLARTNEPEESVDDIEFELPSVEWSAASSPAQRVEPATGSDQLALFEAGMEKALAQGSPAELPSASRASREWPSPAQGGLDIFPEPTRTVALTGDVDVFGSYRRSARAGSAGSRSDSFSDSSNNEPAFYTATRAEPSDWLAQLIESDESSPGKQIPSLHERDDHG